MTRYAFSLKLLSVVFMTPLVAVAFSRVGFRHDGSASRVSSVVLWNEWVGGFPGSNSEFAYPRLSPDLSSLPMLENLANIDKLERMQKVLWPEFSWETKPGVPSSRCFQMFAPDISRIGYTDQGRVYSIICPRQRFNSPIWGNLNVEVTVTGQRGWVDEPSFTVAADMSVVVQVWFSKSARQNELTRRLERVFRLLNLGKPLPFSKEDAIKVTAFDRGRGPGQSVFALVNGTSIYFNSPPFAKHWHVAYGVANLQAEVGPIVKVGQVVVDEFNQVIVNIFNRAGGNIIQNGNVLAWNVWFNEPELVNKTEWKEHAEVWRKSLEADHGSPEGDGTRPRFYNGDIFKPFWPFDVGIRINEGEDSEAIAREMHKKADAEDVLQLLEKYSNLREVDGASVLEDTIEELEDDIEELRKRLQDFL